MIVLDKIKAFFKWYAKWYQKVSEAEAKGIETYGIKKFQKQKRKGLRHKVAEAPEKKEDESSSK